MLTPNRNKALVCRWLEEVFSRGDLDAADELFTSNCALHDPSFPEASSWGWRPPTRRKG
jgi:hypothetical protein